MDRESQYVLRVSWWDECTSGRRTEKPKCRIWRRWLWLCSIDSVVCHVRCRCVQEQSSWPRHLFEGAFRLCSFFHAASTRQKPKLGALSTKVLSSPAISMLMSIIRSSFGNHMLVHCKRNTHTSTQHAILIWDFGMFWDETCFISRFDRVSCDGMSCRHSTSCMSVTGTVFPMQS